MDNICCDYPKIARGFSISGKKTLFEIRVFNPLTKRYRGQNLEICYEINEKEKKKHYKEMIQMWSTEVSYFLL